MPNKFGDMVQDTVAKARKMRDKYTQAASDLARVPGDVKSVATFKPSIDAFSKAEDIQRKQRKGY